MNEPRGNGRTGRNSIDENRPSWRPSDQTMRDEPRVRDDDQHERWDSQRGREERWTERGERGMGGYQDRQQGGYSQDYRQQGYGQHPYGSGGSREWGAGHHQSFGQRDTGYGDRFGHEQDWNQQTYRHGGRDDRWGHDRDRDQRSMSGGYGEDRYGRTNYMGGHWGENRGMIGPQGPYGGPYNEPFDDRGYAQRMGFGQSRGYGAYEGNRMGPGMGMGSGGFGGGGMDIDRREGSYGQQGLGHRGKGPKNFQRSDERIKERVSEALHDDDDIDASEIEVDVKNGEVTLRGTVDDRRQKRLAEECIERIPGVTDVQNQLRIGNNWQVANRGNQSGQGGVGTQDSDKKHRA